MAEGRRGLGNGATAYSSGLKHWKWNEGEEGDEEEEEDDDDDDDEGEAAIQTMSLDCVWQTFIPEFGWSSIARYAAEDSAPKSDGGAASNL